MAAPRFSWDYNFGHIVTAASIIVSAIGGGLFAYTSIESKLVDHETRIVTIEHSLEKSGDESHAFQSRSYDLLMDIRDRLSRVEGSLGTAEHHPPQH